MDAGGANRLAQLRSENYGYPATTAVFLVGAGVAERSWEPVLDALGAVNRHNSQLVGRDQEAANLWFARWLWLRRFAWWTRYSQHSTILTELEPDARQPRERELDEQIERLTQEDLALKTSIAEKLTAAVEAGRLRIRPRFLEIANEPRWRPYYMVTANWDRALEPHAPGKNMVMYLHGDSTDPKTLFLPDESTQEHYRGDERSYLSDRVNACWKIIAAASDLCIYGLSMSPLDADLASVVEAGLSEHNAERPCHIHIFDLDCQLDRIERRVRLLFPPGAFRIETSPVATCSGNHH